MSNDAHHVSTSDDGHGAQTDILDLPRWGLVVVAIVGLSVAALSLFLTYVVLANPAWTVVFSASNSGVIEFVRTLVSMVMWVLIVGCMFSRETSSLLQAPWRGHSTETHFKIGLVVVALLFSVAIVIYHVLIGPANLLSAPAYIQWREANPTTDHTADGTSFLILYLAYMPYSMVNYIVIYLPFLVVTTYAASIDAKKYARPTPSVSTPAALISDFRAFRVTLRTRLQRYSWLFLAVSIAVTYERTFGIATLAESIHFFAYASLGLVLLALILVMLLGLASYQKAYDSYTLKLIGLTQDQTMIDAFEKDNSPLRFVYWLFRTTIAFVLGIAILSLVFPLAAKLLRSVMAGT